MMVQAPAHWCRVRDQGDQRGGPGWTGFKIPDSDLRFLTIVHETVQKNERHRILVELWARPPVLLPLHAEKQQKPQLPARPPVRGRPVKKTSSSIVEAISLKCTVDTCIAQHLHRLVEAAHTVGAAAVVVQRPK